MDFFTKNKMLFWCVVVLVLLNVATLGSFWLKKPPLPPAGSGQGADGQRIMEERLGLSDEQATEFKRLREEHFMRTRPLQEKMHRIRLHLLDEIFAPEPDETLIEELFTELGEKQTEFERNLYTHFQEMKDVCTPEQMHELRIMLRGLIERTRPRDPQQHPRGPGGQMRPNPDDRFGPEENGDFGPERMPPGDLPPR